MSKSNDDKLSSIGHMKKDTIKAAQTNPEYLNLANIEESDITKLEKLDYLAIFIAMIQTVFAPLFVLMGLVFVFALFLRFISLL